MRGALATGIADVKVRRQKNDQLGDGQLAHIASLLSWGGARPVHLLSGWPRLRKWLAVFRDHAPRLSGAEAYDPLFVGSPRARFGPCMAASGMSASWKRVMECRNSSPQRGGARLYLMNGMSCEATQELGGWKTPCNGGERV